MSKGIITQGDVGRPRSGAFPIALVIWNEWCDKAVNRQKGAEDATERGIDYKIPSKHSN